MKYAFAFFAAALSCTEPVDTCPEPEPPLACPEVAKPVCETVQEYQVPLPKCGAWGAGFRSTRKVRKESYDLVKKTAARMGASASAIRVVSAMAERESSGDPCSEHLLGRGEYGLGVLGLSCHWHREKWSGRCDDLRNPAVATIVAFRIFRIAVGKHKATTWTEVNSVFATGRNKPRLEMDGKFCARTHRYGVDCNDDPRGQLGALMGSGPVVGQQAFLREVLDDES